MSSGQYRRYILFRGIIKDYDDFGEEMEFGELDAKAYNLKNEIDRLEPNRDPQLELDYLGTSGNTELIFNFRTSWMDREADVSFYIEEVQEVIENGLDMLITEKEMLGIREER